LKKKIRVDNNKPAIELIYRGNFQNLGVEFSLGIFNDNLKINGKYSLYELNEIPDTMNFNIEGSNLKPIKFSTNEKFTLLSYPIETISSSESGFEKIFQGFCLLFIFIIP
jgi:hypothetical protein